MLRCRAKHLMLDTLILSFHRCVNRDPERLRNPHKITQQMVGQARSDARSQDLRAHKHQARLRPGTGLPRLGSSVTLHTSLPPLPDGDRGPDLILLIGRWLQWQDKIHAAPGFEKLKFIHSSSPYPYLLCVGLGPRH